MNKNLVKLAVGTVAVFGMGAAQATDFLFSDPGGEIPSNAGDLTCTSSLFEPSGQCKDGDWLTDMDTSFIEYTKDGIVIQVSGTQTDGMTEGQVIQDLDPDWGGLAINGGTGDTDNMNDGETLTIALQGGGGILLNSVSFFDEDHGIPIDGFTDNGNDVKLEIYLGGGLVTTLWFALTDSQATFGVGFHGDTFIFTALSGSDNFYVAAINVPEPATLALLGLGLLGFGFARRRRS